MKKSVLFTLSFVAASFAAAAPVSLSKATAIAQHTLHCESVSEARLSQEAKARWSVTPLTTPTFYLFNNGAEDGGFVIVSGDDEFPSVLGYSTTGCIPADAPLPDAFLDYLEFLSEYIGDVQAGAVVAPRKGSSTEGTPVVAPILTTRWGQGAPFNLLCPKLGNGNCVVGCVATAMAQVMKKWNWPAHGRSVMSYTAEGIGSLSLNFENSSYDWENMYNTTLQNSKGEARKAAVSRLSYDCGVASRMQYGASSGTTLMLARIALGKYLGYAASKIEHYYRDCYDGGQEKWNDLIKRELDAGNPIIYAAQSASNGSGADGGHCFVFDGYDSNDYVHVNWGWEGSCDGYYAITVLDPDGTGYVYSESQEMILGIRPDYEWNDDKEDQVPMRMLASPTVSTEKAALGTKFTVAINEIYNYSGNTRSYYLGIGLFDRNGKLLEVLGQSDSRIGLNYYYGYKQYDVSCVIPSSYGAGDYVIRVIEKQHSNTGEYGWILPNTVGGSLCNWLKTYIHDGTAYFNQVSTSVLPMEAVPSVSSHEYFDLSGRKLQRREKGIVLDRQMLPNGKKVVKVYR